MALRRQWLSGAGGHPGNQTRYAFSSSPAPPPPTANNISPNLRDGQWTEFSGEETEEEELLLQAVPSRRRCSWWRELLCILLWVVIASAVPATIFLTIKHQTHDVSHLGLAGDTIELLQVDGFWYEFLRVSQFLEDEDDEHRIQLYLPQCSEIKIYERPDHYVSPKYLQSFPTRQIAVMEYTYLLAGSSVTYNFCMQTNGSTETPSPQFFIFNKRSQYMKYIYGAGNGQKSSVFNFKIPFGKLEESPICSTFTFDVKKSSYYFMTGTCDAGITYQYNVSLNIKYVYFKDYKENKSCSALTTKHDCEIPVGSQFLSKSEKYCLLAHIIPQSGKNQKKRSPTTHMRVNAGKREGVAVIPIIVIILGVVGLLVVMVTYCCCCCKKCCIMRSRPKRRYTLINV